MLASLLLAVMIQPSQAEINVRNWFKQAVVVENLDWGIEDENAMVQLCWNESRWKPTATNRQGSSAYGLYQFLDSTWAPTGVSKTSDPYLQTLAAVRYIRGRKVFGGPNGTPVRALEFWNTPREINGRMVHYY